jgi:pantoate kinase
VKTARAFAPAGISSFFEICDTLDNGKPITDPQKIGARGGGFVIEKGVTTQVSLTSARESKIEVEINGKRTSEAETTKTVVRMLLQETDSTFDIKVKHQVQVPIGAGFGTSAAGALGTALALSKALDLTHTYNQLGQVAHAAEIKCKTGLGTVGPVMIGGCILTTEPGGPGTAVIDRIPLTPDLVIVAAVLQGIPTERILSSPERRRSINNCGRKTLNRILAEPSVENFMRSCLDFAEETGFMNSKLRKLADAASKAGAVGVAQNMVGEAIHAITTSENAQRVVQAFMQVLPQQRVLKSRIDFQGARLLG